MPFLYRLSGILLFSALFLAISDATPLSAWAMQPQDVGAASASQAPQAPQAQGAQDEHEALIERFLELSGVVQELDANKQNALKAQEMALRQRNTDPGKIKAALTMMSSEFDGLFANILVRRRQLLKNELSLEELKALIAFYETPQGRTIAKKLIVITQSANEDLTKALPIARVRMQAKLREILEAKPATAKPTP
jgi:hypothetical protein